MFSPETNLVLVLFIAAFFGAALAFALFLAIAPAWSFWAGMVGGAVGVTLAAGWLHYVHRKRARALSGSTHVAPKPDLVSPP